MVFSWFKKGDGKAGDKDAATSESSQTRSTVVDEGQEQQKIEPTQDSCIIPLPSIPPYIEPSHVMLGVSFPFFFQAYRLYHSPLENLIEKVTKKKHVTMTELKEADVGVRKAVGTAVAGRALRMANLVSFGSFGLFGAAIFFVYDWKSVQEGVDATRRWGKGKRKTLDNMLGVKERIDEDHPEMIAREKMTPEEESAYLTQRYWTVSPKTEDDEERKE